MTKEANERAVIGGNNPPQESALEAFKASVDTLNTEAGNWLDGEAISTEGQAGEVSRMIEEARNLARDAEKLRKAEKQPHLDAGKAVDAAWKEVTTPLEQIATAAKALLSPWLIAKEEAARKAEAEARRVADEAAAKLRAEREAADKANIAAQRAIAEQEEAVRDAEIKAAVAAKEGGRAKGKGQARAVGLRAYRSAEVSDYPAFLAFVRKKHPQRLRGVLDAMAAEMLRENIPMDGVKIIEEKRAA